MSSNFKEAVVWCKYIRLRQPNITERVKLLNKGLMENTLAINCILHKDNTQNQLMQDKSGHFFAKIQQMLLKRSIPLNNFQWSTKG